MRQPISPLLLALSLAAAPAFVSAADKPALDYNRDIRPILSDNCFACHGPDKNTRKSGYRLDTREGALALLSDGEGHGIVPGKPFNSAVIDRLTTDQADEMMPPKKTGKKLTAQQVETLKHWITEGAQYKAHWSDIPPEATPAPQVDDKSGFVRTNVDRFILERLLKEKLTPNPEADRVTQIRRLSFDLTGLPPTPADVDAFVNDTAKDAYEKVVDRLLASPHFGERMAVYWLDLVRFADTIGYHSDNPRDISPYRDYVIQSFNENKPFNLFTTEQLAGDLLPSPTVWQKVASGYNRLLQTTEEGGAQAKEYEAKYAADRVRNVSAVWLASTMICAECHDHKFDPTTAKDFYAMAAFFADVKEATLGRREAGMFIPAPDQAAKLKGFEDEIAALKKTLDTQTPELAAALAEWEKSTEKVIEPKYEDWHVAGPYTGDGPFNRKFEPEKEKTLEIGKAYGKHKFEKREFKDGEVHQFIKEGNSVYYLLRVIHSDGPARVDLSLGSDDGIKVFLNNAEVLKHDVGRGVAPDQEKLTISLKPGKNELLIKIHNSEGEGGFYFKVAGYGTPKDVQEILNVAADKRNDKQKGELEKYYRTIAPTLKDEREKLAEVQKQKDELEKTLRRTLVTTADKPRMIRIKPRGNWMDDSGEVVEPQVPASLGKLEIAGRRPTRLDLATWLTDPKNPRTSRVFVNRAWMLFFGTGISKSLDDMGAQGEWPTHPELLDALATDFAKDWDVKRLIRTLVTSGTYRQSSQVGALRERDPFNRLYARQSRFRIDAEFVRDNALSIAGLLKHRVGGESAKPYQPKGYWSYLNFPTRDYSEDSGDDQYRRGVYTWWQRSFVHPSLVAFDAPSREEAACERSRSNTPQQALVLLNDPTYVEAARNFASRIIKEGGADTASRLQWAYRQALSRKANDAETAMLSELVANHLKAYQADKPAAETLLKIGQSPRPQDIDPAELAAWTNIARVILNLHEAIVRM